ncbi:hypothetical protein PanWU01x14_140480 [Parasponia andersonii]|uniref:Uncharacterized protein n=1 Tax=Parasponia andersonii TaxID=3476 RepID=A0A2P5CMC7_PARAD|nr:hypothetical protein PanWU01x14_140480 [Parasponia andersonii]
MKGQTKNPQPYQQKKLRSTTSYTDCLKCKQYIQSMKSMIKISNNTKLMLEMVHEKFFGVKAELAQANKGINVVRDNNLFKVAYVATGYLVNPSLD